MAISDKLTKLKSDLTDSYKELNIDNLVELGDKNTNNLPSTIDNVLDKIKGYIPTNTDTDGTCENAIPLNASVEVDGNSKQDTTTGKNLIKPMMATSTVSGVTCTNNGDGTFTLNGTATAGLSFRIDQANPTSTVNLQNYDGTYTMQLIGDVDTTKVNAKIIQNSTWYGYCNTLNETTKTKTQTFTANDCFCVIQVVSGTTLNNAVVKVQFEKGSSATDYEPYTGGIASPNPSYPQAIEVVKGKNLFDDTSVYATKMFYQVDSTSSTGWKYKGSPFFNTYGDYYDIKPNTTYTMSFNSTDYSWGTRVIQFDSSGNMLTGNLFIGNNGQFTTLSNTKFIRVSYNPSVNSNVMIEEGTTATTYLPYNTIEIEQSNEDGTQTRTYQIPLGENYLAKVGSVQDKLVISRNGKCKISKNISNTTFTGSENWAVAGDFGRFDLDASNFAIGSTNNPGVISSHFTSNFSLSNHSIFLSGAKHSLDLMFAEYAYKLADFKTWLSTNKPIVYYQLATPSEIELETTTPIHMWEGTNIFTLDTNIDTDFEVTYYIDAQQALLDAGTEV